jgi:hypothetical protein
MKTRREWLKRLPLQKRLQFMEVIRKHSHLRIGEAMEQDVVSGTASVMTSCVLFDKTRQGFDYWYNINNKYYEH